MVDWKTLGVFAVMAAVITAFMGAMWGLHYAFGKVGLVILPALAMAVFIWSIAREIAHGRR